MSANWMYVCMSSTCGYVELTSFAPSYTKRCPPCGGTLKREQA